VERDKMTVLIYVDTNKQVGDRDHLKVFANVEAAEAWFTENERGLRIRGDRTGLFAKAAVRRLRTSSTPNRSDN
jgi:hypothetical protein